MHYLMHGSGFQTWEYSPAYAIRSYAYVWLNMLPIKLYAAILEASKILQFYFLRCVLAFICSLCEIYFYRGICKNLGANTGRISLCFLLFSSGYFISCAALLPSTFSMYCTMTAMAGWMLGHYPVAIFSVAASAIVAWPFAGALGWESTLTCWIALRKHKNEFAFPEQDIRDSKLFTSLWVPGTHGPWSLWVPEHWVWVPSLMFLFNGNFKMHPQDAGS